MIAAILVLAAAIAAAWWVTRRAVDELARRAAVSGRNHRGLTIAATGGIALILGVAVAAAIVSAGTLLLSSSITETGSQLLTGVTFLVIPAVAFGFFGLYDDVAGSAEERGWSDHLAALRAGRATPGALKILAGGTLGFLIASQGSWLYFSFGEDAFAFGPGDVLLDALTGGLVIALTANLVNAFDMRPLRAMKASAIGFAALLAASVLVADVPDVVMLGPVAVLIAVLAALAVPERQERIMLGDSGANALGAMLGAQAVFLEGAGRAPGPGLARWLLLAVIVGLTVVSHRPGFNSVIQRAAPLRAFDRWGRQPDIVETDDAI